MQATMTSKDTKDDIRLHDEAQGRHDMIVLVLWSICYMLVKQSSLVSMKFPLQQKTLSIHLPSPAKHSYPLHTTIRYNDELHEAIRLSDIRQLLLILVLLVRTSLLRR